MPGLTSHQIWWACLYLVMDSCLHQSGSSVLTSLFFHLIIQTSLSSQISPKAALGLSTNGWDGGGG